MERGEATRIGQGNGVRPEQDGETRERRGQAAERELVLERLLASHETWFDVYRDYEFGGRTWPGYAEFHSHGEQYVLVKRAKLWEVDAYEYLFFTTCDRLDAEGLEDLVGFVTTKGLEKVHPDPNHMTSYLSLVVVADEVPPDVRTQVKRTRFRKNFALGIRGWADLRVAAIDLSDRSVTTNSQGRDLMATLEANLAPTPASGEGQGNRQGQGGTS